MNQSIDRSNHHCHDQPTASAVLVDLPISLKPFTPSNSITTTIITTWLSTPWSSRRTRSIHPSTYLPISLCGNLSPPPQHTHTHQLQVNAELEREAKEQYAETLAAGQQRK